MRVVPKSSQWHTNKIAAQYESIYANTGLITIRQPAFSGKRQLALSLIMPVIVHGFYDFCLFMENNILSIVFILFLVFLYVKSFSTIKKMSANDNEDHNVVMGLIYKKYPELIAIHEANKSSAMM